MISTSFVKKPKEKSGHSSPKQPHAQLESSAKSTNNVESVPISSPMDVTPSTSGLNSSDNVVDMENSAVDMETDSVEEEFASQQFSKIEDYTIVYEKHSLVSLSFYVYMNKFHK